MLTIILVIPITIGTIYSQTSYLTERLSAGSLRQVCTDSTTFCAIQQLPAFLEAVTDHRDCQGCPAGNHLLCALAGLGH